MANGIRLSRQAYLVIDLEAHDSCQPGDDPIIPR